MPTKMQNTATLRNEDNNQMMKRYVHQPLKVEHNGLHASIQENGKVVIQGKPKPIVGTDEVEYDEVEVPASLVFKLANLLKATRTVKYVPITMAVEGAEVEE